MVETHKKSSNTQSKKKKNSHHKTGEKTETKNVKVSKKNHEKKEHEKRSHEKKDHEIKIKSGEKEHKSRKKVHKKIDKNNLLLTLFMIILIIAVAVLGYKYYSVVQNNHGNNMKNTQMGNHINKTTSNALTNLYIVEDPTCKSCHVDYFVDQVKNNLIHNLVVKKIDYRSAEGKEIVKELNLKQVPTFLFSKEITNLPDWSTKYQKAFLQVSIKGKQYYELNPQFVNTKVLLTMPKILKDAIIIGNKNAPVTLFYFTDFECPFCAIAENNSDMVQQFKVRMPSYVSPMPMIMKNYVDTGKVKIVFYNNPIEMLHPKVRVIHLAALCANEQGKFRPFERNIWNKRSEWIKSKNRTQTMIDYAKDLGLNVKEFTTCLVTKKYNNVIDEDLALSKSYGIMGTPSFFINRRFVTGARNYSDFKEIIDQELNNSK